MRTLPVVTRHVLHPVVSEVGRGSRAVAVQVDLIWKQILKPGYHLTGSRVLKPGAFQAMGHTPGFNLYNVAVQVGPI
jgi:hypothetical protein